MVFLRRSSYKFHTVLEFTNLVINGSIKLHLHPPNGDMGAGVMRPLDDGFSTGNEPVLGTIDITRGAFCVVRDTSLSFSCGRSLRKCAAANVEVLGRVKECSRRGIPICWYLGVHRSAGH